MLLKFKIAKAYFRDVKLILLQRHQAQVLKFVCQSHSGRHLIRHAIINCKTTKTYFYDVETNLTP